MNEFKWQLGDIANFDLWLSLEGEGYLNGVAPTIEIRRDSDDFFYDFSTNLFSNNEASLNKEQVISQTRLGGPYRYVFNHDNDTEESYKTIYRIDHETFLYQEEDLHSFLNLYNIKPNYTASYDADLDSLKLNVWPSSFKKDLLIDFDSCTATLYDQNMTVQFADASTTNKINGIFTYSEDAVILTSGVKYLIKLAVTRDSIKYENVSDFTYASATGDVEGSLDWIVTKLTTDLDVAVSTRLAEVDYAAADNDTISNIYSFLNDSELDQIPTIYQIVSDNLDMKISDLGFSPENLWAYPNRSLTNPNDYKADVSQLATQDSVNAIAITSDNILTKVNALTAVTGDTNTRLIALDAYIRENSNWEEDNTEFI